jgi:acyl carrier protein
MDSTELRTKVRQVVGEMSPLGPREAQSTDRLAEELGYDSLAVIELSLRIEQEFAVGATSTAGTPDISTVADIEDLVERAAAAAREAA